MKDIDRVKERKKENLCVDTHAYVHVRERVQCSSSVCEYSLCQGYKTILWNDQIFNKQKQLFTSNDLTWELNPPVLSLFDPWHPWPCCSSSLPAWRGSSGSVSIDNRKGQLGTRYRAGARSAVAAAGAPHAASPAWALTGWSERGPWLTHTVPSHTRERERGKRCKKWMGERSVRSLEWEGRE